MNLSSRLDSLVKTHSDLFRIAATVLAASILVVLFVLTQPIDLRHHNLLLGYFSRLQRDEAKLGEAVLQLNFSLTNNYDQVTAIMANMHVIVHELNHGEVARDLRNDERFRFQLLSLTQRLSGKQETLERFKSHNAVLKNSLIYLSYARHDLRRDLPSGTAGNEAMNDLVEYVLLNRISVNLLERSDMEPSLDVLQESMSNLPDNVRTTLDRLMRHARKIDQYERETPALIRQLTSGTETESLAQAYRDYYDSQQRTAAGYRVFLLLATLALLGYAILTFMRLRESSRRLKLAASVFAHASECITITDTHGSILDVNPAFTKVTGYSREEALGENPRLLQSRRQDAGFYEKMWQTIRDTGQWQGEIWNRRKNGETYPEWLTITAVTAQTGEITHYIGSFIDITQRKQDEADIYYLAFHDPLTKLPNRRLLLDRLRHILVSGARRVDYAALLFIDLDNFKTINDTQGHETGDQLLIETARRLQDCVREGDTIARLGGDEFVVMLQGLSAEAEQAAAQAKTTGEKIRGIIGQPYMLLDSALQVTCSIGIRLFDRNAEVGDLLKHADTAMYAAKSAGRNTVQFFDPAMQTKLEARAAAEADLRQALVRNELGLLFQIQVSGSDEPVGAEVLLCWKHPHHSPVSPAQFIPLAEETGLIVPIGQWVLEAACVQLKCWEKFPHTRDLTLSVNVSGRQFREAEFVARVRAVLKDSRINPARLKLEITESAVLDDVENVIATMRQLKTLGVRFSMDDFGTGYSSLQYLKRLLLDQIKIDQSFVRDITVDSNDVAIVRTIIAMAQTLDLDIIAEGVETEAQRHILREMGCSTCQGYLFSKPVPIKQFEELLKRG